MSAERAGVLPGGTIAAESGSEAALAVASGVYVVDQDRDEATATIDRTFTVPEVRVATRAMARHTGIDPRKGAAVEIGIAAGYPAIPTAAGDQHVVALPPEQVEGFGVAARDRGAELLRRAGGDPEAMNVLGAVIGLVCSGLRPIVRDGGTTMVPRVTVRADEILRLSRGEAHWDADDRERLDGWMALIGSMGVVGRGALVDGLTPEGGLAYATVAGVLFTVERGYLAGKGGAGWPDYYFITPGTWSDVYLREIPFFIRRTENVYMLPNTAANNLVKRLDEYFSDLFRINNTQPWGHGRRGAAANEYYLIARLDTVLRGDRRSRAQGRPAAAAAAGRGRHPATGAGDAGGPGAAALLGMVGGRAGGDGAQGVAAMEAEAVPRNGVLLRG